jgi:hypothetical protein
MSTTTPEAPSETRRILIQKELAEDLIMEIQPDWKITFGAVNPGSQMSGRDLHCLRIYDGPNTKSANLRAVICDVRGFRDLAIPLARKVSKETGAATWTQDSEGGFDRTEHRELETSWSEPDRLEDIPF